MQRCSRPNAIAVLVGFQISGFSSYCFVIAVARTILGVGRYPAWMAADSETLPRNGFNVIPATTIPAALAVYSAFPVDAVVVGRSISPASARVLVNRLLLAGGPPVTYLGAPGNEARSVVSSPQHLVNQNFLFMLRLLLMGSQSAHTREKTAAG